MPEEPSRIRSHMLTLIRLGAILTGPIVVFAMHLWPRIAIHAGAIFLFIGAVYAVVLASVIGRAMKAGRVRVLAMIVAGAVPLGTAIVFVAWREGHVVAAAEFNPGLAPFEVTVREVPVPVTRSDHFIVTLWRGQYPVTSFRYFWLGYTPSHVKVLWPQLDTFMVLFDNRYEATCHWSWGGAASWTMQSPAGALSPGALP